MSQSKMGKGVVVGSNVKFGKQVVIWNYVVIGDNVTIGDGTCVGSFCDIGKDVSIGNKCNIQSHVTISNGSLIGDNVFIGPNCSILNDKYPKSDLISPSQLKDNVIVVRGIDAFNGTPVVDIKPFDYWDIAEDISVPKWWIKLEKQRSKQN